MTDVSKIVSYLVTDRPLRAAKLTGYVVGKPAAAPLRGRRSLVTFDIIESNVPSGSVPVDTGKAPLYDTLDLPCALTAVWSLRKAVSTYSGPLVRIRDTSTGVEQDVGFDANGDLAAFTVTGQAAVVRVYDQLGGDDLVQPVTTKQPILLLAATPTGKPAIKLDGVDDFLKGETDGTARPYMVADPAAMFFGGGGDDGTRESYASIWKIPHVAGSNTNPYTRFGINSSYSGTDDRTDWEVRINGVATSYASKMFSSNRGWTAHFMVQGRFMEAFMGPGGAIGSALTTYPNNTAMYVGSNGAGDENWGGYFFELAMFNAGGSGLTQADREAMRDASQRIAIDLLYGRNTIYSIIGMSNFTTTFSRSIAEAELYENSDTTDVTTGARKVAASHEYNSTEKASNAFDDNANTLWSSGVVNSYTDLVVWLNAPANVSALKLTARSDSYYLEHVKQFYVVKHTTSGPMLTEVIDLTEDGVSPGQNYVKALTYL